MPQELFLSAGDAKVSIALDAPIMEGLKALTATNTAEVDLVFGSAEPGAPWLVAGGLLSVAAEAMIRAVESGIVKLGTVFVLEDDDGTTATGGQFPINGVDHSFRVGRDRCTMQTMYRDSAGMLIQRGELIDIRHLDRVQTDHGDIRIRRRKKPTVMLKALKRIKQFGEEHAAAEVELLVC